MTDDFDSNFGIAVQVVTPVGPGSIEMQTAFRTCSHGVRKTVRCHRLWADTLPVSDTSDGR